MTPLLQIDRLTKSYGDRLLFADVTFGINEGDKIGIVAKNGTGKTTLLSIIAGREAPDSGTVVARNGLSVGYLEQKPTFEGNPTVAEAALCGDDPVAALVRRYEAACANPDDPETLQEIMHSMDSAGAWDYEDTSKTACGSCSRGSISPTSPPASTPSRAASASVWRLPPYS